MPEIRNKKSHFVFPSDTPISHEELVKAIKDAEKGPFYTSDQVKQALRKWNKKYSR